MVDDFYLLMLHSKKPTKFSVLKQPPLYYSWLSVNWTGLGRGESSLLHVVLPGTAWNTQGGLTHASNVGAACRLGLPCSPRGLLLPQCSLGFFPWRLGCPPAKVEAASLLKGQARKSQQSSWLLHGAGQSQAQSQLGFKDLGNRFHLYLYGTRSLYTHLGLGEDFGACVYDQPQSYYNLLHTII